MTMKPLRPCRHPGCSALTREVWCEAHRPKRTNDRSEEAQSWRWMYRTNKWLLELRPAQLLREPFCRECARLYPPSDPRHRRRATDVDHIVDHKGDWERFCDPDNLESLCHSCHSRKTARELWQNRAKKRR